MKTYFYKFANVSGLTSEETLFKMFGLDSAFLFELEAGGKGKNFSHKGISGKVWRES